VIDDPDALTRKAVYLDQIRGLYRRERTVGFMACLAGVLLLLYSRSKWDAPHWMMWLAIAVIAAGWGIFAFVIFARTSWVRTHPFDPNG
jgi:hypothetical protein